MVFTIQTIIMVMVQPIRPIVFVGEVHCLLVTKIYLVLPLPPVMAMKACVY